jgi:uncharacterized protein
VPKKTLKPKHIPQRTCVGCREVNPKRSLVRIVRQTEAVVIDQKGKMAGRGAYLHNQKSCWERGLKGSLEQALKTKFSDIDREILFTYMQSLSDDGIPDELQHAA